MKFNDIEAIYTKKVAEYIANGYTINTGTMAGHQGEIAKVDLRKGDEVIRIMLKTGYDFDTYPYETYVTLIVGRNTNKLRGGRSAHDTIWNDHLEVIEEMKWFEISETHYTDADEAKIAAEKKIQRWKNRPVGEEQKEFCEAAKAVVLPFVKRQPRCKGCKLSDINRVYKYSDRDGKNHYVVIAKTNHYRLK